MMQMQHKGAKDSITLFEANDQYVTRSGQIDYAMQATVSTIDYTYLNYKEIILTNGFRIIF